MAPISKRRRCRIARAVKNTYRLIEKKRTAENQNSEFQRTKCGPCRLSKSDMKQTHYLPGAPKLLQTYSSTLDEINKESLIYWAGDAEQFIENIGCCVKGCPISVRSRTPQGVGFAFFEAPVDPAKRRMWSLYLPEVDFVAEEEHVKNPARFFVCQLHFVDDRPTINYPHPTQNLRECAKNVGNVVQLDIPVGCSKEYIEPFVTVSFQQIHRDTVATRKLKQSAGRQSSKQGQNLNRYVPVSSDLSYEKQVDRFAVSKQRSTVSLTQPSALFQQPPSDEQPVVRQSIGGGSSPPACQHCGAELAALRRDVRRLGGKLDALLAIVGRLPGVDLGDGADPSATAAKHDFASPSNTSEHSRANRCSGQPTTPVRASERLAQNRRSSERPTQIHRFREQLDNISRLSDRLHSASDPFFEADAVGPRQPRHLWSYVGGANGLREPVANATCPRTSLKREERDCASSDETNSPRRNLARRRSTAPSGDVAAPTLDDGGEQQVGSGEQLISGGKRRFDLSHERTAQTVSRDFADDGSNGLAENGIISSHALANVVKISLSNRRATSQVDDENCRVTMESGVAHSSQLKNGTESISNAGYFNGPPEKRSKTGGSCFLPANNQAVARAALLFAGRGFTAEHLKAYGPTWLSGISEQELKSVLENLVVENLLKTIGLHEIPWKFGQGCMEEMVVYKKLLPERINRVNLSKYSVSSNAYSSSFRQKSCPSTSYINVLCNVTEGHNLY